MWQCPECKLEFEEANQNHSCREKTEIDGYIAEQDEKVRPILEQVRQCIRAAAPEAVEKLSWRMPTFWQHENLIHFAAFKHHLGIYPGDLTLSPFEDRLAGYYRTKGAVRFPFEKPIDFELIADITRWRVEQAALKRRAH